MCKPERLACSVVFISESGVQINSVPLASGNIFIKTFFHCVSPFPPPFPVVTFSTTTAYKRKVPERYGVVFTSTVMSFPTKFSVALTEK